MSAEKTDFQKLRTEFISHAFNENDTDENPLVQFEKWFNEVVKSGIDDANAMVLSTVSSLDRPRSRVVLLKGIENGGFVFYTNYQSAKGREFVNSPFGALNFFWQAISRQVRIEGKIEKVKPETSDAYFQTRPVESRLGAAVSPQSEIISDRKFLEDKVMEAKKKYSDAEIPRPEHWGGYILIPDYFEFWQGRENRLHDRICYQPENNGWKKFRLAP